MYMYIYIYIFCSSAVPFQTRSLLKIRSLFKGVPSSKAFLSLNHVRRGGSILETRVQWCCVVRCERCKRFLDSLSLARALFCRSHILYHG